MKTQSLKKLGLCLLVPGVALADGSTDENWQVRAAVYGYLPDISGTTQFAGLNGTELTIDADDLVDNTDTAFMTSIEAQKGRVGLFADLIYMDVGNSLAGSTTLAQGNVPLPPGVTADAALGIEASAFEVAANFRLVHSERMTLDAFAGARRLDAEVSLDAKLSSPLGPVAALSGVRDEYLVDAMAGVKGKYSFGGNAKWFVPFYVDAGAGDSDRTRQAATGIGFTTRWGEVFGTYRYLDYDFDSSSAISDLDFSGPAIGVSYRF